MEIQKKKCSFKEHLDINANIYCKKCGIYMCNKCEVHHSKLFVKSCKYLIFSFNLFFFSSFISSIIHILQSLCCPYPFTSIFVIQPIQHNLL